MSTAAQLGTAERRPGGAVAGIERTRVVHCRHEPYDVYIGRLTSWENPFTIGVHGGRAAVIARYEEWILNQPDLLARLHELRGMRLGCWCSPKPCHGDVLARLAEQPRSEVNRDE
jgi:hypothetical protein